MGSLGDILILGLGASGRAAARWALDRLGDEVDSVTVADSADSDAVREQAAALVARGARAHVGVEAIAGHYDTCVASPGIPPHSALLRSAHTACDRVISEIELAYEHSACTWVAITGTNGKTTTTALVAHLLETAGIETRAVGNIGTPAIEAVAHDDCEVLVAEVSSFQLASTRRFHPRVAVLLNVTPDHVDWHGSLESYAADKGKVFANLAAGDTAIIDVDDAGSAAFVDDVARSGAAVVRVARDQALQGGAGAPDGTLTLFTEGGPVHLIAASELQIKGPHNVSNALAAASAAFALGVSSADLAAGLRTFEPIAHRLQPAGSARGAEWFNDSKATNPDAVHKAIEAFSDRPFVLLLGGRNKGNDFTALARSASSAARAVVVFGEAADDIAASFVGLPVTVESAATMRQAMETASRLAHEGDAVVLSPACASFDEFANYEQRGDVFCGVVADWAGER